MCKNTVLAFLFSVLAAGAVFGPMHTCYAKTLRGVVSRPSVLTEKNSTQKGNSTASIQPNGSLATSWHSKRTSHPEQGGTPLVPVPLPQLVSAEALPQDERVIEIPEGLTVRLPSHISDSDITLWNEKLSCYLQVVDTVAVSPFLRDIGVRMQWRIQNIPADKRETHYLSKELSPRLKAAIAKSKSHFIHISPGDEAMERIDASYDRLHSYLELLDTYYSSGSYAKDNGVAGEEMLTIIARDSAQFSQDLGIVQANYEDLIDWLRQESLERYAQTYGKTYYWQVNMLMHKSENIIELMALSPDQVNRQAYGAAFDSLTDIVKSYCSYITRQGAVLESEVQGTIPTVEEVMSFMQDCKAVADSLQNEEGRQYIFSTGRANERFGKLVELSNTLIFKTPITR